MSELRRRMMMQQAGGGGGVLPPEYQQVEWLQRSGGAYLTIPENIDVYHATFTCVYSTEGQPGNNMFFGNGNYFAIGRGGNSGFFNFLDGWPGAASVTDYGYNNEVVTVKFVADAPNFSTEYSREGYSQTNTGVKAITEQTKNAYYIFDTLLYYGFEGRLYRLSIETSAKNHDFITCYRKADNEPGMYDIINDVFYTNAGSGSFVVGPDVN